MAHCGVTSKLQAAHLAGNTTPVLGEGKISNPDGLADLLIYVGVLVALEG